MQNASHSVREELFAILLFVGSIWCVFFASCFFPDLKEYGIVARTIHGLIGVAACPFLHANYGHLTSNTVPLFILLALLAGSKARSWEIVVYLVLLGGLLLWAFGRGQCVHVGASGLVFGLVSFLIFSGFIEQRIVPMLISLLVGFLYGGTLLTGIIPQVGSNISWDGHLFGVIAGVIVAYYTTRETEPTADSTSES